MSDIGALLRRWRRARGHSQLKLALTARVSTRHLSFIETGRASPSREMILRLARVLDVPLRERNVLLEAAGFAPIYGGASLDADDMGPARRAVDLVLRHHEPYPCVVTDSAWNVLRANRAAVKLLDFFSARPPAAINSVRLVFDDDGLKPWIDNWSEVAAALVQYLHREAMTDTHGASARRLLDELLATADAPGDWHAPDLEGPRAPLLPVVLKRGAVKLALFNVISTLGTPRSVALEELRIETSFPVDEASDALLRRWAAEGD